MLVDGAAAVREDVLRRTGRSDGEAGALDLIEADSATLLVGYSVAVAARSKRRTASALSSWRL